MSATTDLHAQLAQRLFGWTPHTERVLVDPARPRLGRQAFVSWQGPAGEHRLLPPAYSTDPAATALVWQWVEACEVLSVTFHYAHLLHEPVLCQIGTVAHGTVTGYAATWPEALCRAALALADALEGEETP